MPLGLSEMMRSAAQGCRHPRCAHDHDHGPLYLHGRCHPQASVSAEYKPQTGTLTVFCDVCLRPVMTVYVAEKPAALKACHPQGLAISFDRDGGVLRLVCRQCGVALPSIRVAEGGN